ncbi:MAG: hydroxymethylbilane synthase [Flavobacteriales bacterium]|nr:hydroxymethylbilane synthase [Flavobacteriales bacterium]
MKNKLTIGTRSSKLALYQSNLVKSRLEHLYPDITFELLNIKTKGDIMIDKVLDRNIDKGFFVSEIQNMLMKNEIDIAVHSLKDLPVEENNGIKISAILKRGNEKDVFISKNNKKLSDFLKSEKIGTSSLRRKAQLYKRDPNLNVVDIRGNVDTRISKMIKGQYEGLVMAAAGIERLGLDSYITEYLDHEIMLNAPGQGAIAIEINRNNKYAETITLKINDEETMNCTQYERSFMKKLGGGCNSPIGAYSYYSNGEKTIIGTILSLDGTKDISSTISVKSSDESDIGELLANELIKKGALELIN